MSDEKSLIRRTRLSIGPEDSCEIVFGENALAELTALVDKINPDKILAIVDDRFSSADILGCLGRSFETMISAVPGHESIKSFPWLQKLLGETTKNLSRDSLIVSIGGGTTGNLAGVVAGLTFRGIDLIHVPTTLMAQVDGAVGMKQAINGDDAKNAIGLFHLPRAVVADTAFWKLLPTVQLKHGLVECFKVALAARPDLLGLIQILLREGALERSYDVLFELGWSCIQEKASEFSADPRERQKLFFLELGHGVAHALERASEGCIHHGAAVAFGILVETRYASKIGVLSSTTTLAEIEATILDGFRFDWELSKAGGAARVVAMLKQINNRGRRGPKLALLQDLGTTVVVEGLNDTVMEECLKSAWPSPT